MSDIKERGSSFLRGLILGCLAGVGLFYFLTSTKEGKKVKKKIEKRGKSALDSLAEMIVELEEKGEEFKKKANKLQAELEEKTKDIQKEVVEEAREGLSQIEKLRERGRRAAKFFTRNGKSLV